MKALLKYNVVSILLAVSLIVSGCGDHQADNSAPEQLAETGHEGHNHAPGAHGKAVPLAVAEESGLDWCPEHSVPESQCTQCNPSLIEGFVESGDWCAGHELPESHCRLCNPGITLPQEEVLRNSRLEVVENDISVSLYFRPNASVCATDGALIQFASAEVTERSGITTQSVRVGRAESTIDAPAEIVFDETKVTVVTSTVAALVSRWLISPGDAVETGSILAILKSPDIAQLKSSLVSAHTRYEVERKELERHREMKERDLISEADYDRQASTTEQVRAEYVSARGLLLSAGLTDADIEDVIENGNLSNQFVLRAASSGMVVERMAQLGELVEAGRAFAKVADPRSMWIEARLTEAQMQEVDLGQELTFSSDGGGMNRVGSEIIWVSRFLDPHTRTGTVRARVLDPNHRLRAGEFGRAKILRKKTAEVSLVPKDAVQWEGCCNVVFVRDAIDRFRPRRVTLLDRSGPYYQVSGNISPGEEVVVEGAFLLKTELKKSSIGAGCCGLDPVG